MTDAELAQIEEALGLKLPEAYRRVIREIPDELREWPPAPGETENRKLEDFLLDVDEIIAAQKGARKRLRRALPKHSFVFGRGGEDFWLIDVRKSDPPVRLVFDEMLLDGIDSLGELLERVKKNHQDAWAKAARREKAGATAAISGEELIAEARRLARPAMLLREEGVEYAAVWKGTGVVPPPEGEWEHWISLDAGFLPDNPRGLEGVLSVYLCVEDSDRFHEVAVAHHPGATLPKEPDGQRLFAERHECPPPMEALLKFGSPRLQQWLQAHSVDPDDGYDPRSFDEGGRKALKAVERFIADEHPFSGSLDCAAMLGGWSAVFLWCYGIDEPYPWELLEKTALVVLTLWDEEPWLEVFDDGSGFQGFSRIT